MLQHFQYQPLYQDRRIPGWTFSFYFSGKRFEGIYHQDGTIEWLSDTPNVKDDSHLQKEIHDLMLYHVYDSER
ncbi:YheE family protein [Siminovitchia sediminis]|uniref:YheE family protein n=1 Tax=Siminovitchia sediminis TaxID=1274353 RepID=A0ABW4KII3_9BACI